MARPSLGPPTNDQDMALLETDKQGLMRVILEAFPSKLIGQKLNYAPRKKESTQTFYWLNILYNFSKAHDIKSGSPRAQEPFNICSSEKFSL